MRIKIKGQIVTADDWLQWRFEGKTYKDIAAILGVPHSTIRSAAKRFRNAGYSDAYFIPSQIKRPVRNKQHVQCIRTKRVRRQQQTKFVAKPDITTDSGAYILGVLWLTASWSSRSSTWTMKHRDKWYLNTIEKLLKVDGAIPHWHDYLAGYEMHLGDGLSFLWDYGWRAWHSKERPYPTATDLNHRGFIRAIVELRHYLYLANDKYPVIRITANEVLICEMSKIIAVLRGAKKPAKPFRTGSKSAFITYTGKSIRKTLDVLYDNAEIYHPGAKEKLYSLLIQKGSSKKGDKYEN